MNTFSYKDQHLGLETKKGWQSLSDIVKSYNHPIYVYSLSSIERRARKLSQALSGLDYKLHYAVKANTHPEILKTLKVEGCGVDTVSLGEMKWAIDQGFPAEDIILSGVGKSKSELTASIEMGIFQVNVESIAELKRLGTIAKSLKKSCRFGIRLNPDIKVDTHPYISTGFRENKFGIPEQHINEAVKITKEFSPWLEWCGLSVHIGSQIRSLEPLIESAEALVRIKNSLAHYKINIEVLDVGGGLGINYQSADETEELMMIEMYGARLKKIFKDHNCKVALEPGRILVGRSGALLTQVEYPKYNGFKNFIIVNSGMNHLMRPCLYEAYHRIVPVIKKTNAKKKLYDIVGPICESSDVLGYDRRMQVPSEGDWLAVMDTGAYGFTMSSTYNLHDKPGEICL